MTKKSEATLLLKIKTEGKEKLDEVKKGFGALADSVALNAGKAVAAVVGVTTAMAALVVKSEKFEQVKQAFTSLATSQGKDADAILAKMKEMTDGMVSSMDLMVAANKAILLGLPVDKFPEMLKIAKAASEATGESMQFMLDSVVTALGRQSKLILDNLGIMIDVEKAYDKYAKTLGKTSEQLTEAEKKQAFINEALAIGLANSEAMGAANENQAKTWARLKVQFEESAIAIGNKMTPAIAELFAGLSRIFETVKKITESEAFLAFGNVLAHSVKFATNALEGMVLQLQKSFEYLRVVWNAATFDKDDMNQALKNIDEINKKLEDNEKGLAAAHAKIQEEYNRKRVELAIAAGKEIAAEDADLARKINDERMEQQFAKDAAIERASRQRLEEEKRQESKNARTIRSTRVVEHTSTLGELREMDEEAFAAELERQAEVEEERNQIRAEGSERAAEIYKELLYEAGQQTSTFLSSGFQGVAQSGVSALTEIFLPRFGQAAGQMFALLSQDSNQFLESINTLFSTQFLDNIANNIPVLFERLSEALPGLIDKISERLPDIVTRLVEALIEHSPRIAIALGTAFSKPEFYERMVLGIANGFANGVRDGAKDLHSIFSDAMRKAWEDVKGMFSIDISAGGGGGGGGGPFSKKPTASNPLGLAAGGIVGGQKPVYASGGRLIDFMPRGTDTVPAMLTPGEFVVNAAATRQNRGDLEAINSGGSAGGGPVTINLTVNGGLMGDQKTAREFAKAMDSELLKLRQTNQSVAFDKAVF